jgi:hypothetical protein
METALKHPILGTLTFDRELDCWEAFVWLQNDESCNDCWDNCGFDFYISVEDPETDPQPIFNLAIEYLDWVRKNESTCRNKIADDLLGIYNDVWADNNSIGQLNREDFIKRILPESLNLNIDESGILYYGDSNLFAGHSIEIFIESDRSFGKAHLIG